MSGTRSFFAVLRCPRRSAPFWLVVLFFLGVSILACPLLAHSQDTMSLDTQGSTPSISVRGTVINTVTRQPIGHALVISGDNRYAAFSDDSGGFEFQVPGSQQTQFTARKPGLFDAEDRSMFEQQNAAAH
jgi:hypothetical protein